MQSVGTSKSSLMPQLSSFDIDIALARIEEAVAPYPKAAMFALADLGYASVFEQLISCILSIRTKDEVSLVESQRLFERARTPEQIAALSVDEIDALIDQSTFHENKAPQIQAIARETLERFGDELPCDYQVLTGFKGVGPKCANLALGVSCGEAVISVDTHVHKITNRWGYVETKSPDATLKALEEKLPRRHWIDINRLLVPFGKHVCTTRAPRCSECPVQKMCAQVGVKSRR